LYCNGPLPRAGSSASSTRLLARPSLFGDGPVLTGVFPFFSASRFPDGIATIKQQTMSIHFIRLSETRTDDDITTNTHTHTFWQLANRSCKQPYRTPPLIFMSYSSYGSSASSTRLLARPSLFGDGPVLTGRNEDRRRYNNENTRRLSGHLPTAHVNNHYRTPPLIFMSYSSYGEISLARSMSAAVPTLKLNCDYFNFE
ncbi:hypothetical protein T08_9839, partial [Trichinella sp. T8]